MCVTGVVKQCNWSGVPCDYSIISKKYKFPLRADYDSTDFHNARPRAVIMTIMPALGP